MVRSINAPSSDRNKTGSLVCHSFTSWLELISMILHCQCLVAWAAPARSVLQWGHSGLAPLNVKLFKQSSHGHKTHPYIQWSDTSHTLPLKTLRPAPTSINTETLRSSSCVNSIFPMPWALHKTVKNITTTFNLTFPPEKIVHLTADERKSLSRLNQTPQ